MDIIRIRNAGHIQSMLLLSLFIWLFWAWSLTWREAMEDRMYLASMSTYQPNLHSLIFVVALNFLALEAHSKNNPVVCTQLHMKWTAWRVCSPYQFSSIFLPILPFAIHTQLNLSPIVPLCSLPSSNVSFFLSFVVVVDRLFYCFYHT